MPNSAVRTIIRRMQPDERGEVVLLVNGLMRKRYRCEAHRLPEIVFVAIRGEDAVGTIAISPGDEKNPLPLENIYRLNYSSFPEVFERSRVIELGRWVARERDVAKVLFYAAVRYGIQRSCRWAIGELKPVVLRHFARMGIATARLSGELSIGNIPTNTLPYYLTPPKPILCATSLAEAQNVLEPEVKVLSAKGKIGFCYP